MSDDKVFISEVLTAYPIYTSNSNKAILPHSLLNEIMNKGLFDRQEADKPMIFELSVSDPDTGDVIAETHCGVEDFTAEKGKIGLPYKTALSLTQERGIGWLHENPIVYLMYKEIERHKECSMKVQPRGQGFFEDDQTVVNIDIKTVLELTLKNHLVLTEGDWIPLFHEGREFTLVVHDLKPDEVVDVLNTDMTVEILPSEQTEQEQKEQELKEERVKQFEERGEAKAKKVLDGESTNPVEGDKTVLFDVKMPNGRQLRKLLGKQLYREGVTFGESVKMNKFFDYIEGCLHIAKVKVDHPPANENEYHFDVSLKAKSKAPSLVKSQDAFDKEKGEWGTVGEMLKNMEGAKKITVTPRLKKGGPLKDENDNRSEEENGAIAISNQWVFQGKRLHNKLKEDEAEIKLPNPELVERIKNLLLEAGCEEELSSDVSRLYPEQVDQLSNMGYTDDKLKAAATLLKQHSGDVNKVADALFDTS